MDINYMKEFVVLAETGNFLEAADYLYMSQSSLSRHIKSIEEELGTTLFDRTTRKVSLNEYGKAFLPYAKQISQIQYEYTTELMNKIQTANEMLTIGAIPTMAHYHITNLISDYQVSHPDYTINIIENDSLSLINDLNQGKCDLAFIRESDKVSHFNDLVRIPYTTDNMVAVLPASHPCAGQDSITLDEIKNENLLLLDQNTLMYALCLASCEKSGFTPKVKYTGHRAENMISLVSKGMGIALLTKRPAQYFLREDIAIVDIHPLINTKISLVYTQKHEISCPAKNFMKWLTQYLQDVSNENQDS